MKRPIVAIVLALAAPGRPRPRTLDATRRVGATGSAMARLVAGVFALQLSGAALSQETAASSASAPASGGVESRKHACRPDYPPAAMRAKAEGTTILELTIAATGELAKVTILQSAGPTPEHRLLDDAAVQALRSCPFKPAVDGTGKPVDATLKVNYDWYLDAASASAARKRRQ